MSLKKKRQEIWKQIKGAKICAVTKDREIKDVKKLLKDLPKLKCIAENRWPDCEEKFKQFKNLEKHFIGALQSNKVRKVVPLVDVIQSVNGIKLLERINQVAGEEGKKMKFCFQVNISDDYTKRGLSPEALPSTIEFYLNANYENVELIGLMTIGKQCELEERRKYFRDLKKLFDKINKKYFPDKPLPVLSMGMSKDYEIALEEGATMVRLGTALFEE